MYYSFDNLIACLLLREGNDPALVDDDIIFEDFARLRLKGAETEEADA